jgi:putative DNA primase/helicase
MDRDLEGKLIGELSGIFNWALEGYRRLRQKSFRLEESQSMKLTKQDYRSEMDSVRAFASDCLIKTKDAVGDNREGAKSNKDGSLQIGMRM